MAYVTRAEHIELLKAELAKKQQQVALRREEVRRAKRALFEAERNEYTLAALIYELGLEETQA